MNKEKRRCVLALILASFCVQASDAGRLHQALRHWHPLAVTRRHDTVTVILNEDRVTPARYEEVIGRGVCAGIWRRRAPSRYLASVSQMQVLCSGGARRAVQQHAAGNRAACVADITVTHAPLLTAGRGG
ncbi:TPA: hypothetical protein MIM71_08955 [Klebsiella variicola]|uniref:hypothetical protein n=1 Tax=Klebsiella variicola TaxID=244366 RepID=UPI001C7EAACB|nr:hypothetical protein [Klebsiella variicola]MBX4610319.1 hypothetical protein [Klebsiella variicola]HBX9991752.1 hypothetical protein [Klebsiella variicola]